jgi:hypothetical protein
MNAQQGIKALRQAQRLWQSDDRFETYAAILLVVIFLGWPTYRAWKASRR